MVRTTTTWLTFGEKPSKYLAALEKKKQFVDKTMRKIVTEEGNIVTDQKMILKEVESYYKDLFKKNENTCVDNLDHLTNIKGFKKLPDLEAKQIEKDVTIEELGDALRKMSNGKSPDIDGFPCQFFKVFWLKLKYFVMRSVNNTFTKGEMSTSLKQCLIICIPKGDKDRQFLKNW